VGTCSASAFKVNSSPIVGNPSGLVFSKNGRLLTSLANNQTIVELNPTDGTKIRVIAKLPTSQFQGFGLAIDPLSGDLFVSQSGGTGPILRINYTQPNVKVTAYSSVLADGIGFDSKGTLYAATGSCAGGGANVGIAAIAGTDSSSPGSFSCVTPVPSIDGLAVSPKPGTPILFGNRNDGTITEVVRVQNQPPTVIDIFTGGSRGDFATVGDDGCVYATQSSSIIKVTDPNGKCPLGGFYDASGNLASCVAPCSTSPVMATSGSNEYLSWKNNTSGDPPNLLLSVRNNNGSSLGPTVKITNSTTQGASQEQIATAGSDVYIAWQQNISLTTNNILFRASTNNGTRFGPLINISSGASCGSGCTITTSTVPQVATAGNNVYVVWLASTTSGNFVMLKTSTNSGSSFANALTLSSTAYGKTQPQLAALSNFVYITWADNGTISRARTFFASSSDGGTSFGSPVSLSNSAAGETDISQEIATAGNSVYVTWTNETTSSTNTIFSASTNNGATFGVAINLNAATAIALQPEISASGNNVYVVWSQAIGGNTEVVCKVSSNNGATFGNLLNLSNVPGTSNAQTIASSGNNVYVSWIESGTSNSGVYFASSNNSGSTFTTPVSLINDTLSHHPFMAGLGDHASVAWEDGTTGNGDIYLVSGRPVTFGFSLASSGTISVTQGNSGPNTISLALTQGTAQAVTITCGGGLPAGASCSFTTYIGTPPFSSSLTINTASTTPPGTYLVTVAGRSGDLGFSETNSTQFTLMVKSSSSVGGVLVPVDRLGLLAPYLTLALIISAMTTAIFVRRRKGYSKRIRKPDMNKE